MTMKDGKVITKPVGMVSVTHAHSFTKFLFLLTRARAVCGQALLPGWLGIQRMRIARYWGLVQSLGSSGLVMMFFKQIFYNLQEPTVSWSLWLLQQTALSSVFTCVMALCHVLGQQQRNFFSPSRSCFSWSFHLCRHFHSHFSVTSLCISIANN